MARRLRREEVLTIKVLAEKGEAKRQIARTLGVGESLVRSEHPASAIQALRTGET